MNGDEDEAPKGPAPPTSAHDPEAPGLLRWRQMPAEACWSGALAALLAGRDPVELGKDAYRYNPRSKIAFAIFPTPTGRKHGTVAIRQMTEGDEVRIRMTSRYHEALARLIGKR